jgi:hypothetical protein
LRIFVSAECALGGSSSLDLCQSSAGFDGFSLLFHRRFLVGPADLQFLEQAAFRKLVLQNFQGLLHIVVEYFNFQNRFSFLRFNIVLFSPRR